jgi:NhaA family Na+:H+ antiporter
VIALFYTSDLAPEYLLIAAALLGAMYAMNRSGIQSLVPYFAVGFLVWLAVYESGVHATIAGVVLGLMTPSDPPAAEGSLQPLTDAPPAKSPLERLEHDLHPITGYIIVPIFAFANAGVYLRGGVIGDSLSEAITIGIILGLVLGKPIGIICSSWVAIRLGVARLPEGVSWAQMLGVGMLAGVGFTVALFINELAFDEAALIDDGKIGIMIGSMVSAVLGLITLAAISRRDNPDLRTES